jgi:pyridoxal phosphate enzyme (YggS family)
MNVKNYQSLKKNLPPGVTLVAVSKTKPNEDILALFALGQRHFGENYVQELTKKAAALPRAIHWHFIGHLQTNKVKQILPFIYCIESVDRINLLDEIEKQSGLRESPIKVLLQYRLGQEETKYGLTEETLEEIVKLYNNEKWPHVIFCGMMAMGSLSDDRDQTRREFAHMKKLFTRTQQQITRNADAFQTLSMGMSADFQLAIEEGSNSIRVGSLLFGSR